MELEIYTYSGMWNKHFKSSLNTQETLIILFGSSNLEPIRNALAEISAFYTQATIIGSSSAGEIVADQLYDDTLVAAVIHFKNTKFDIVYEPILDTSNARELGKKIAKQLVAKDLKAMFILSDGLNINGSQLTEGLSSVLGNNVVVTGGLAGDADRFEHTWTIVNGKAVEGYVSAVALYGEAIEVRYGSKGGWDSLGVERIVTKSDENILYQLDDQPALEIYKRYLGEQAVGLPATGLLFPLEVKEHSDVAESKVRTILAVNEEDDSITFAGDIPEGSYVTLMKANYDRLIDGAYGAAEDIMLENYHGEKALSIAISCVGRRLVLKQRTEEELEATLDVLPKGIDQIGFYSYGEISPLASGQCDLHNQTMTLTVLWEKV
jgi:hypothetical protein